MNISTIAFAGVFLVVGLVIFDKVSAGKGILIGAGLLAVGGLTKPDSGAQA